MAHLHHHNTQNKKKSKLPLNPLKNCSNCKQELSGKFCSACGSPAVVKRIDRKYITEEISGVLNFDKGLFYTIKELCLRPGATVNKFINGDRKRLVKPIIFLVICSLIFSGSDDGRSALFNTGKIS